MTGKLRAFARLAGTIFLAAGMASGSAIAFKDQGPKSAACDGLAKTSAAWKACAGEPQAAASDTELFYAGYWLARTGSYADALEYLNRAKAPTSASSPTSALQRASSVAPTRRWASTIAPSP